MIASGREERAAMNKCNVSHLGTENVPTLLIEPRN